MKIAVFSDEIDIRKIKDLHHILASHEILWFTEKYYSEKAEGNISCVHCEYKNRKVREKNWVFKAVWEIFKLLCVVNPERFLKYSGDYPFFDHKKLKDVDICLPFGDFEVYETLRLRKKYGYRYRVAVRDAETIPFMNLKKLDMRHVWECINRESDLFLAWTGRIRDKEIIEGVYPEKIRVLYAGIDTNHFFRRENSRTFLEGQGFKNRFIILSVGKIEHNKGIMYQLLADRILKNQGLDFVHLYLGTGKNFEYFKKLSTGIGLEKCSIFKGFIPYETLPEYFSGADLFTHASISTGKWEEQFGMVLAEAMASKLPVISTVCGSIPDVTGNTAVLVNQKNPEELAGAVRNLLYSPEFRKQMAESAYLRALALFDREKVAARFENYLTELVSREPV